MSFNINNILVLILIIGYSEAQYFGGSRCELRNGTIGICKNIRECKSFLDGIRRRTVTANDRVHCSFEGSIEFICCTDEVPPTQPAPTSIPISRGILVNPTLSTSPTQQMPTTSEKPPTNSFWREWSANKSVVQEHNQLDNSELDSSKSPDDQSENIGNNLNTFISGDGSNRLTKEDKRTDPTTQKQSGRLGQRKAVTACQSYGNLPRSSELWFNILGGIPVKLGDYPWMAALGYNNSLGGISFECGGTIISNQYIMTAAHCVKQSYLPFMVRLGKVTLLSNDDDAKAVDLTIQEIIKHPEYSYARKKNDIALIRVQSIQFDETIRPACLRTETHDLDSNARLWVTGYGVIVVNTRDLSGILLKTNVTYMDPTECNRTVLARYQETKDLSFRDGLSESQLCAFDSSAQNDACQGDSGGPLQYFTDSSEKVGTVAGIISFGQFCGTSFPSIYTRVSYFIDWIETIVWPDT